MTSKEITEAFPELALIKNKRLRETITEVWSKALEATMNDVKGARNFPSRGYPSETDSYPDLTRVGVVEHTRSVAQNAMAIAQVAKKMHGISVDTDYLVAACLIHDLDKLAKIKKEGKEYVKLPDSVFPEGSPDAKMRKVAQASGVSERLTQVIAPARKIPRTSLENVILVHADLADADLLRKSFGVSKLLLDSF